MLLELKGRRPHEAKVKGSRSWTQCKEPLHEAIANRTLLEPAFDPRSAFVEAALEAPFAGRGSPGDCVFGFSGLGSGVTPLNFYESCLCAIRR